MAAFYELILGGARSGKSRIAEQLAIESGKECIYLATAAAADTEMATRIKHHQQRRQNSGQQWLVVEETVLLAEALKQYSQNNRCILVDCLTLWLSNCLHEGNWQHQRDALTSSLTELEGHIILVSNEVGSGIVPLGELSRQFVDESGFLHQSLAAQCDRVTLVVAGLPMTLKDSNKN